MNTTRLVQIDGLPTPRGPFSNGVITEGRFLFVAGQGPWDPARGDFARGSIAEQTELTLRCIERVVQKAGGTLADVVSCRVFLQPLDERTFAEMNAVYARFFPGDRPARTTVGCSLLGIDVEIDAIVRLPT